MDANAGVPLVVAVVGTDHHPFDRLVRMVDDWALGAAARVVIQHGTARPPRTAQARTLLEVDELDRLLGRASAVVCHGGPGTIAAVRRAGRMPIVIARDPALGEHVDDHQQRFVPRMVDKGMVLAPADAAELHALLDSALVDPAAFRVQDGSTEHPAVARFAALVDGLVEPSQDDGRTEVLYIGGWGRSGSTLLDRMLGQVPGMFSAGELRDVVTRGVVENRLCGCGSPFRECDVWSAVGESAFGGWDRLNVARLRRLRDRLDRPWSPPRVLVSRLTPSLDADVIEYADHLDRLYAGIVDVTGARMVVDSSKIPTYALLLRQARGIRVRVLHLVRDARGVAFSWQKQVVRDDGGGRDHLDRYGAASASARYLYYNGLTHALRATMPYRLLRYEDLIARPRAEIARALAFAGMEASGDALAFLGEGTADLAPNHTVDGNPMRSSRGAVTLRLDEAWRHEMSAGPRRLVTAATSPLLAAYGYPLGAER